MEYTTYWSILDTPSRSIQANHVSLGFAVVAALLWFLVWKYKKNNADGDRSIILWGAGAFVVLGLAGFITLTFFIKDKTTELTLQMLDSPNTRRVEGVVSDFKRSFRQSSKESATSESFLVDSVRFGYSDEALGRFNSFTETYNHVIFNGQKVRVTYKCEFSEKGTHNTILKLEIAK